MRLHDELAAMRARHPGLMRRAVLMVIGQLLGFKFLTPYIPQRHESIVRENAWPIVIGGLIGASLGLVIDSLIREKRFSLRTLLLATTLVAVVLRLIVYATRQ